MKRIVRKRVRHSEDGINIAADMNIAVSDGGSVSSSSTSSTVTQTPRRGQEEPKNTDRKEKQ